MGLTVVEQQQQQQDLVDKKKKRRSNRRSKLNSPPLSGSPSIDITEQNQQVSSTYQSSSTSGSSSMLHDPEQAPHVAFNSLPLLHMNEQGARQAAGVRVLSRSYPTPNRSVESAGLQDVADLVPQYLLNGYNKQKRFQPHWPSNAVKEALERGELFQAQLRVNAHNRLEAYCTIKGVSTDIFINGLPRQNRAVEGDVVAIKVDPPVLWSKMKGSAGSCNASSPTDDQDPSEDTDLTLVRSKGKNSIAAESGFLPVTNCSPVHENGLYDVSGNFSDRTPHQDVSGIVNNIHANGRHYSGLDPSSGACYPVNNEVLDSVEKLCQAVVSLPSKRPTGAVVAIIEPSSRRDSVVGFLNAKWWFSNEGFRKENRKDANLLPSLNCDYIHLVPIDPKLPKMIVPVRSLPANIKIRLDDGDALIETELVAAKIDDWADESLLPQACVVRSFGRGGDVEPRIEAILFENAIFSSEFSMESLSCLPDASWQVPQSEFEYRRDIRNLCVFTIDPSTATDLDDALSVERLSNGVYRVGVHIADVSYFVQPDTALDTEAQARSTSVYMLKRKISMLPALLSEKLGSLIPGVDRLTFSIFWVVDVSGNVLDRWVGRTVIRSCCKLSYEHAQDIIDGRVSVDSLDHGGNNFPELYGNFGWHDVFQSVRSLHEISKALKDHRFRNGALRLDNAKIVFLLDEFGVPYDCMLSERKDSNFLVEEFMLLANRTAAEIITKAFPDGALLRRHPEPNMRKLKEFELFCRKHGLELDASSSGSLHASLEKIREKLKDDSVFSDILINYATKPMQLATYFCSGDITVGMDDWGHYALAVPLYTHFTSPLRRYPDILVHRTLTAAIEAEQVYLQHQRKLNLVNQAGDGRCFTGMNFSEIASQSVKDMKALSSASLKHRLPCSETLSDMASYCNQRKWASRQVKDAIDKLYMWVLLKNREILLSEARVLGIGPRFMSIYVKKLAIERRIYYDEVDGLIAEWLDATSTLVLNYVHNKRFQRRGNSGRYKALEEVALMASYSSLEPEFDTLQIGDSDESCQPLECVKNQSDVGVDPAVFPLTLRVLSTIPVALHAVGGDDGPVDIAARLYVTSYFR